MNQNEFIPFGVPWMAEMNKQTKAYLIERIRESSMEKMGCLEVFMDFFEWYGDSEYMYLNLPSGEKYFIDERGVRYEICEIFEKYLKSKL